MPGILTRAFVLGALVLTVTACSSDDDSADAPVVQLGAPGGTNRVLTDEEVAALPVPGYTATDVTFVQQMIGHHAQALRMTELVDGRTARGDVPKIAERIEVSQHDEIAQMNAWLEARGQAVPDPAAHTHGDGALMPGMLTEEEFAQLEAASGTEFDRLFLLYMIRHHQGAVQMVTDLFATADGGQEPEVFQLAQHIDADQRIEIARMNDVLEFIET